MHDVLRGKVLDTNSGARSKVASVVVLACWPIKWSTCTKKHDDCKQTLFLMALLVKIKRFCMRSMAVTLYQSRRIFHMLLLFSKHQRVLHMVSYGLGTWLVHPFDGQTPLSDQNWSREALGRWITRWRARWCLVRGGLDWSRYFDVLIWSKNADFLAYSNDFCTDAWGDPALETGATTTYTPYPHEAWLIALNSVHFDTQFTMTPR